MEYAINSHATERKRGHPIADGYLESQTCRSCRQLRGSHFGPGLWSHHKTVQRIQNLLEEIELADHVGLDVFGIGEHHRAEFLDSAPVVILSAAATRTKTSASRAQSPFSVLPIPVRVFQDLRSGPYLAWPC